MRGMNPAQEIACILAPEVGLEPTTTRLTVACSTIELLRNRNLRGAETTGRGILGKHFLQRREDPHFAMPERCPAIEMRSSLSPP